MKHFYIFLFIISSFPSLIAMHSEDENSIYTFSAAERQQSEMEAQEKQRQRDANAQRAAELIKQTEEMTQLHKVEQAKKYSTAVDNLIGELRRFEADRVENYLVQLILIDHDDEYKLWNDHYDTVLAETKTARFKAKYRLKAWIKEHPIEGDPQQDHTLHTHAVNSLKNKWAIKYFHNKHLKPVTQN